MNWISLLRSEESEIERVRGQEDRVFIKVALIQREITNDLNISLRLHSTMTRCLFKTSAARSAGCTTVCSYLHLITGNELFHTPDADVLFLSEVRRVADWVCFVVYWLQEVVPRVWCQKKRGRQIKQRSVSPLIPVCRRFCLSPSDTK